MRSLQNVKGFVINHCLNLTQEYFIFQSYWLLIKSYFSNSKPFFHIIRSPSTSHQRLTSSITRRQTLFFLFLIGCYPD
jgi:hypothetical protein